jgi:UDP-glucose 4-epimerase
LELEKIDLKILLTGAFGSIGIYTLKELIKKGNKVSVLENI